MCNLGISLHIPWPHEDIDRDAPHNYAKNMHEGNK